MGDPEIFEGGVNEAQRAENWGPKGQGGRKSFGERQQAPPHQLGDLGEHCRLPQQVPKLGFFCSISNQDCLLNTLDEMFLLCQNKCSISLVCVLTVVVSHDCLCGPGGGLWRIHPTPWICHWHSLLLVFCYLAGLCLLTTAFCFLLRFYAPQLVPPGTAEARISLSLIHIWRCRRSYACRSRWSPYH